MKHQFFKYIILFLVIFTFFKNGFAQNKNTSSGEKDELIELYSYKKCYDTFKDERNKLQATITPISWKAIKLLSETEQTKYARNESRSSLYGKALTKFQRQFPEEFKKYFELENAKAKYSKFLKDNRTKTKKINTSFEQIFKKVANAQKLENKQLLNFLKLNTNNVVCDNLLNGKELVKKNKTSTTVNRIFKFTLAAYEWIRSQEIKLSIDQGNLVGLEEIVFSSLGEPSEKKTYTEEELSQQIPIYSKLEKNKHCLIKAGLISPPGTYTLEECLRDVELVSASTDTVSLSTPAGTANTVSVNALTGTNTIPTTVPTDTNISSTEAASIITISTTVPTDTNKVPINIPVSTNDVSLSKVSDEKVQSTVQTKSKESKTSVINSNFSVKQQIRIEPEDLDKVLKAINQQSSTNSQNIEKILKALEQQANINSQNNEKIFQALQFLTKTNSINANTNTKELIHAIEKQSNTNSQEFKKNIEAIEKINENLDKILKSINQQTDELKKYYENFNNRYGALYQKYKEGCSVDDYNYLWILLDTSPQGNKPVDLRVIKNGIKHLTKELLTRWGTGQCSPWLRYRVGLVYSDSNTEILNLSQNTFKTSKQLNKIMTLSDDLSNQKITKTIEEIHNSLSIIEHMDVSFTDEQPTFSDILKNVVGQISKEKKENPLWHKQLPIVKLLYITPNSIFYLEDDQTKLMNDHDIRLWPLHLTYMIQKKYLKTAAKVTNGMYFYNQIKNSQDMGEAYHQTFNPIDSIPLLSFIVSHPGKQTLN